MKPHLLFGIDPVSEQATLDQFFDALSQDFVLQGALMPDAHLGYSLPIGAVVATDKVVVPSWVGYDIGCGMCALPTSFPAAQVREAATAIFDSIYQHVPVGFAHNREPVQWMSEMIPSEFMLALMKERDGWCQLGSLGGGNHFIEIGEDEFGNVWIITHSGSRGIGHATATHHMKLASPDGRAREGHFGFHVGTQHGHDYLVDHNFCLEFALANRREIVSRVEKVLREHTSVGGGRWSQLINRNHNHVDHTRGMWIHRKGATHAEDGMLGVIPGNMRDGSFIVRGKGNPGSLYSSSHGAGRVLGRKVAKQVLSLNDFESTMEGVTARVTAETLDESPFAYKSIEDVMAAQSALVAVVARVRPIINVKG